MEKKKKISRIITVRLFIAVFIAFIVSSSVTYAVLYYNCVDKARQLMFYSSLSTVSDIEKDTRDILYGNDESLLMEYQQGGEEAILDDFEGSNYSYVARLDGTIYISGNEAFIGKNVNDIEWVSVLINDGKESLAQGNPFNVYSMTPSMVKTLDGKYDMYYMVTMSHEMPDSILVTAYAPEDIEDAAVYAVKTAALSRNIGLTGFNIAISADRVIMTSLSSTDNTNNTEFPCPEILDRYDEGTDSDIEYVDTSYYTHGVESSDPEPVSRTSKILFGRGVLWDTDCFYFVNEDSGFYILSLYPAEEALQQANDTIRLIALIEVVVFAVLFIVLHLLIKRRVIRKLDTVNASLGRITGGDLEERVEVRDTAEFDTLSNDINATVDRLKGYIAEAAARFDADLAIAKAIQTSALPSVFPPFPEHKEFELFASMNAAKEVGGDFYDFYMLNDTTLGFLIADVSGKSIPGAMFMMTAKTVIKSLAESGLPPADVFTRANEKLCEGNEAEMFVTAWLGYLDLKTGLVRVANAGHNPPILIHEGRAEYVILKPGLMLAGMDGVRYREQTLQLEKGDMLYLYTDGVTEAMDKDEEQYGEDRLKTLLSFGENTPTPSEKNGVAQPVCEAVIADVLKFTDGADQSDDITMLCVRYLGASDA